MLQIMSMVTAKKKVTSPSAGSLECKYIVHGEENNERTTDKYAKIN